MITSRTMSPKKYAAKRPPQYFDLYAPGTAAMSYVRPLRPKRRQQIRVRTGSIDSVSRRGNRANPAIRTSHTKTGASFFSAKAYQVPAQPVQTQTEKALLRTEQILQKHLKKNANFLDEKKSAIGWTVRTLTFALALAIAVISFLIMNVLN